jgi:hypothetical protein
VFARATRGSFGLPRPRRVARDHAPCAHSTTRCGYEQAQYLRNCKSQNAQPDNRKDSIHWQYTPSGFPPVSANGVPRQSTEVSGVNWRILALGQSSFSVIFDAEPIPSGIGETAR